MTLFSNVLDYFLMLLNSLKSFLCRKVSPTNLGDQKLPRESIFIIQRTQARKLN